MKKEFVTFSTSQSDESYYSRKFSSDEMALLGIFFSVDYSLYKFSRLIEWACDPEFYHTHANITFLEKEDDRMVIGDLYDKKFPRLTISLPSEKFVKLLNDWEQVASKRPKKIIITKEGDEVAVEGKN